MTIVNLIHHLVESRAAIVRTEHHVQVPAGSSMHDVWIGREGLKWKLAGMRRVLSGPPEKLLAQMDDHVPESTDLAWMKSLAGQLRGLERVVKATGKTGIFVDAGFKNGKARAALVKLASGGDAEIIVRCYAATSAHEAESEAIRMAQERWPGELVHSDCQGAAKANGAKWVPRERNREADAIGNMRGK